MVMVSSVGQSVGWRDDGVGYGGWVWVLQVKRGERMFDGGCGG